MLTDFCLNSHSFKEPQIQYRNTALNQPDDDSYLHQFHKSVPHLTSPKRITKRRKTKPVILLNKDSEKTKHQLERIQSRALRKELKILQKQNRQWKKILELVSELDFG